MRPRPLVLSLLAFLALAPAGAQPAPTRHVVNAIADGAQPRILVRWSEYDGGAPRFRLFDLLRRRADEFSFTQLNDEPTTRATAAEIVAAFTAPGGPSAGGDRRRARTDYAGASCGCSLRQRRGTTCCSSECSPTRTSLRRSSSGSASSTTASCPGRPTSTKCGGSTSAAAASSGSAAPPPPRCSPARWAPWRRWAASTPATCAPISRRSSASAPPRCRQRIGSPVTTCFASPQRQRDLLLIARGLPGGPAGESLPRVRQVAGEPHARRELLRRTAPPVTPGGATPRRLRGAPKRRPGDGCSGNSGARARRPLTTWRRCTRCRRRTGRRSTTSSASSSSGTTAGTAGPAAPGRAVLLLPGRSARPARPARRPGSGTASLPGPRSPAADAAGPPGGAHRPGSGARSVPDLVERNAAPGDDTARYIVLRVPDDAPRRAFEVPAALTRTFRNRPREIASRTSTPRSPRPTPAGVLYGVFAKDAEGNASPTTGWIPCTPRDLVSPGSRRSRRSARPARGAARAELGDRPQVDNAGGAPDYWILGEGTVRRDRRDGDRRPFRYQPFSSYDG